MPSPEERDTPAEPVEHTPEQQSALMDIAARVHAFQDEAREILKPPVIDPEVHRINAEQRAAARAGAVAAFALDDEQKRDARYIVEGKDDDERIRSRPRNPLLIGLGGRLGAGKDALGDKLVEHHGFQKMGMSDALHRFLMLQNPIVSIQPSKHGLYGSFPTVFDWTRYADLTNEVGYVNAKLHKEYREILQRTGTDAGREVLGEQVWVDAAARTIGRHWAEGHPVVITGMRYSNELAMVRALGGTLVWVERPQANPLGFGNDEQPPAENIGEAVIKAIDNELDAKPTVHTHSSEVSVVAADFDLTVYNRGSLEDLKPTAALLISELKRRTPR